MVLPDRSVFGWFYLIGVCSDGSDRSVFGWFYLIGVCSGGST